MCVHMHMLNYVQLFATPWTVAHQASLSMEFPRQEYWCIFFISWRLINSHFSGFCHTLI